MRQRGVRMHFPQYGNRTDKVTLSACGHYVVWAKSTWETAKTTCGNCKRTTVFRRANDRTQEL